MENQFLERFKNKTESELKYIIDNEDRFREEAIAAALYLLENPHEINVPIAKEQNVKDQNAKEKQKKIPRETNSSTTILSFDHKPFFRSVSYREFLTSFSIALFYFAYLEVIYYYSTEVNYETNGDVLLVVGLIVAFLLNHVFYQLEHRRSNNLIGRSLNDLIFIIALVVVKILYEKLVDYEYSISFEASDFVSFTILVIIWIFIFEALAGLLKHFLKIFKCQIF